jgi:hypothetical protein
MKMTETAWMVELGKHTEDIISLENRRKSK